MMIFILLTGREILPGIELDIGNYVILIALI